MRTRYVKYKPKYHGGTAMYKGDPNDYYSKNNTGANLPYGQIGNFAGTATEALWDDVETADGMDSYQSKNELITSNTLKYAGQGAAMGVPLAAATGGLSIAAGALIGGTYGAIAGNKQGKKNEKLATEAYAGREKRRYLEGQQNYDLALAQGFKPQGNYYQGKIGFKKGGRIKKKLTDGGSIDEVTGDPVKPLVISDPREYQRRKQAYNDSLDVYKGGENAKVFFNTNIEPALRDNMETEAQRLWDAPNTGYIHKHNPNFDKAFDRLEKLNKEYPSPQKRIASKYNKDYGVYEFKKPTQPVKFEPKEAPFTYSRNENDNYAINKDDTNDIGGKGDFDNFVNTDYNYVDEKDMRSDKLRKLKLFNSMGENKVTGLNFGDEDGLYSNFNYYKPKEQPTQQTQTSPSKTGGDKFYTPDPVTSYRLGLSTKAKYTQKQINDIATKKGLERQIFFEDRDMSVNWGQKQFRYGGKLPRYAHGGTYGARKKPYTNIELSYNKNLNKKPITIEDSLFGAPSSEDSYNLLKETTGVDYRFKPDRNKDFYFGLSGGVDKFENYKPDLTYSGEKTSPYFESRAGISSDGSKIMREGNRWTVGGTANLYGGYRNEALNAGVEVKGNLNYKLGEKRTALNNWSAETGIDAKIPILGQSTINSPDNWVDLRNSNMGKLSPYLKLKYENKGIYGNVGVEKNILSDNKLATVGLGYRFKKGGRINRYKMPDGGNLAFNPNLAKEDLGFQKWYKGNTLEGQNNIPYSEKLDYDYFSFYKNKGIGDIKNHFPDTFKRPIHETFSDESIYSGNGAKGYWEGENFIKGKRPRYATGAKIANAEYEVENAEIIEGDANLEGNPKQLASNLQLAVGATHENGGIEGSGGDRVFSARSIISPEAQQILKIFALKIKPNSTHAEAMIKIGQLQDKGERASQSINHREKNTGKIFVERANNLKEIVFADQELQKQFSYGSNRRKFRLGGQIDNTINPDNEIVLTGDKSSLDRTLPNFSNVKTERIKPPVSTGQEGAIKDYLVSKGLTDIAAYGIMGNIGQESNFYSNSTNPTSGAYGLYQHYKTRKDELFAYAKKQNKHYSDAFVQTDFALQEMDSMGLKKLLNAAATPEEAAKIFHDKFERPEAGSLKARQDKAKKYAAKYMFGGNLPQYADGGKIEKKEKKNAVILYSTGKDKKDNTFKIEAERAKPVLNKKYGNTEIVEIPYGNQEELKKVLTKYKDADIFPFDHSGDKMMGIPVTDYSTATEKDYEELEELYKKVNTHGVCATQECEDAYIKKAAEVTAKQNTETNDSWAGSFSEDNSNCVYWGSCTFAEHAAEFTKKSNIPSISTVDKKWQGVGNTGKPIKTEDDFLKQMYFNSDYQYNKPQQENIEVKTKEVPKMKEATVKQQQMLPMFKYGGRLRKYTKGGKTPVPPIKIASWQTNNSDISDNHASNPYYDYGTGESFNRYRNSLPPEPNNGMLEGYVNNSNANNREEYINQQLDYKNSPEFGKVASTKIPYKGYNPTVSTPIKDYMNNNRRSDNYVNAPQETIPRIEIPSGSEKYKDSRIPAYYEGLPNKIPNPNLKEKVKENSNKLSWNENYEGDIANTLGLATNLININQLKTRFKPDYPTAPSMNYYSSLPFNTYQIKRQANNYMKAMNRYNPNSNNKAVALSTATDSINNAVNNDNERRTQFGNQVRQIHSELNNQRAAIDNQISKEAIEANNQKIALTNSAVNTYVQGQMDNSMYRRRLALDERIAKINKIGHTDRALKNYTKEEMKILEYTYDESGNIIDKNGNIIERKEKKAYGGRIKNNRYLIR